MGKKADKKKKLDKKARHERAAITPTERADGWQNVLTGIGVTQRDKRIGATFGAETLHQQELEEMWRGEDLAATIIETFPEQALREGFAIVIKEEKKPSSNPLDIDEDDAIEEGAEAPLKTAGKEGEDKPLPNGQFAKQDAFPPQAPTSNMPVPPKAPPKPIEKKDDAIEEQNSAIKKCMQDLFVEDKLSAALNQARAFGGSALFVGADDGQDPSKPLNEANIKTVKFLTVLNAFELQPDRYYSDPSAPKFGEPETYRIGGLNVPISPSNTVPIHNAVIHESRLIRVMGVSLNRSQTLTSAAPGWGDSVLVRCNEVLRDFGLSWGSAGVILQDYGQGVFKIKELAQLIATDRDDVVINRAKLIDTMRSTARALFLDSEEDFERKGTPLTGYAELLHAMCLRLSAAAKIPVTFLMGQAPAGLSATGDSDIRIFYDRVQNYRRTKVKPALERLAKILFLAKDGPTKGKEPASYEAVFKSLWQPTDKEQAETRKLQAETDNIYITAAVVTPEEIAKSRFMGEDFNYKTQIDFKAREQAVVDFEVEKEEHDAKNKEAMKNMPKDAQPFPPKAATKVTESLQA